MGSRTPDFEHPHTPQKDTTRQATKTKKHSLAGDPTLRGSFHSYLWLCRSD